MISREKKEKLVEELARILKESASVLFADFAGLGTTDLNELKKELRQNEVGFKVTKKSLWPFIFKKAGLAEEPTILNYEGSVAIAYGKNEGIETAKIFKKFAKNHETLKIIGGFFWKEFRDVISVLKLAELPARETLLGMVVGITASPLSSFMGVLKANQRNLVSIISQIKK